MKKKTTEIATNVSSGAEKVENIEKELKKSRSGNAEQVTKTVKKTARPAQKEESALEKAALGSERTETESTTKSVVKKRASAQPVSGKAEAESEAAKARVEAALKRKELQEKRKAERAEKTKKKAEERAKKAAEKKAVVAKRTAEKKALIEKRAAEKKALAEKRKAEREAAIRERAHAKANKNQANSRKKRERKRAKQNKEKDEKGYGGWLAAVIALGAVTLALGATVTVGALNMARNNRSMMSAHRGTMYELTGVMEHVDDDLERIRISNSPAQQSRILTDLLVQARLAESDLEKLPITAESDTNVSSFINRTAAECERLLGKLRRGETLTKEDGERLERLYQANHRIRSELDKLMENMTDKDIMDYIKDGVGSVGEALGRLEKMTLEENRAAFEQKLDELKEAGKKALPGGEKKSGSEKKAEEEKNSASAEKNTEKNAENKKTEKGAGAEGSEKRIDPARAEELCKKYFPDYKIGEFQCVGETVTHSFAAYNVQGYDDKGTLLFAELSQEDGKLLRFDYYEECKSENFNLENAEKIAEEFLEALGYDDMEVVRFRENGTTTDFTFVYEDDDVLYYPDEVRVKVCRTRGVVTGMDATKYLKNHRTRVEPSVKINLAEAQAKLHEGLGVESSRLAVVKTARGERPAYEFLCSYGEEMYFVYVDAGNGEEISIVNAKSVG